MAENKHTRPIDLCVTALLVHQTAVVMVRHRKLDFWLPPGGHVEDDQAPEEALFAEVFQETGLELDASHLYQPQPAPPPELHTNGYNPPLPQHLDLHGFPPVPGHRHLALVYYLAVPRMVPLRNEDRAHSATIWISRSEVIAPGFATTPVIKWYVADAVLRLADRF